MSFIIYAQIAPVRKSFASSVHHCLNEAVARSAGHTVITHPNGKRYEEVVMSETLTAATVVRGVSVRNHSNEELAHIRGVLDRLPEALLTRFAQQYTGIVCVDWTGSNWRDATHPNPTTLLSGGANMDRAVTRGSVTESGRRIELTHAAMYEVRPPPHERRGVYTLWHELGHVAYRSDFTPRTVERTDYGESIHVGAEEQPAYAFMWYFLAPSRLTANDRAAFDRIFGGGGTGAATVRSVPDPLATLIHRPVGAVAAGLGNDARDVRVVQELLNRNAGSRPSLPVTGVCDPALVERIRTFQQTTLHMRRPDGRVDPGGRTLNALVGGATGGNQVAMVDLIHELQHTLHGR